MIVRSLQGLGLENHDLGLKISKDVKVMYVKCLKIRNKYYFNTKGKTECNTRFWNEIPTNFVQLSVPTIPLKLLKYKFLLELFYLSLFYQLPIFYILNKDIPFLQDLANGATVQYVHIPRERKI